MTQPEIHSLDDWKSWMDYQDTRYKSLKAIGGIPAEEVLKRSVQVPEGYDYDKRSHFYLPNGIAWGGR